MGCRRLLHARCLRRRPSRRAAVAPQGDHPSARRGALDRGADRAAAVLAAFGILHNAVRIAAGDTASIERLARYLLRSPVALERMRRDATTGEAHYHAKAPSGLGPRGHTFEPVEFLARLLQHVPEPRLHQVRYYGHYSNVSRARRQEDAKDSPRAVVGASAVPEPTAAQRRRLRRSWAQLIRRIYEVDPLVCRACGSEMRILSFILDPPVIRKILDHLATRRDRARAPPDGARTQVAAAR